MGKRGLPPPFSIADHICTERSSYVYILCPLHRSNKHLHQILHLIVRFLLFQVLGGVLAGFGGWFLKVSGDYKEILEFNQLVTPAVIVIIGGATIFLVAFLGLVGALKESRCLLMMVISFTF